MVARLADDEMGQKNVRYGLDGSAYMTSDLKFQSHSFRSHVSSGCLSSDA